ncbi:MAG: glycosyltransferase, partial [Alphaproteobacteria bacterium]|nr:glycosyltransferase [Alphaproteobacteria bacterium]
MTNMNSNDPMTSFTSRLDGKKILFLVAEDWSFCSHRLPMARAARDAGAEVHVGARENIHRDQIEREGFTFHPIDFDRSGLNPLKDWHTYLEIRSLYKSIKPDLVHHVAMKPVLYGSLAALTSHKPAVVNAMIGLGYLFIAQSLKAKILRPIVKQLLRMLNNRKGTRL